MTLLTATITRPPGMISGTWELTPYGPYAVGGTAVVASFRGNIDAATGALTNKDGTPATVIVPASGGYDAGQAVLSVNFKTATATLPGRSITVPLVETSPGTMDVAYLVSVGRAQVITPQQAVDFQALMAQGYSARDAANAAATAANAVAASVAAQLTATNQSLNLVLSANNVMRYTTDAQRNAANPPNGTWGWAADANNYRHRENGAWVSYDPVIVPGPVDTGAY